MAPQAPPLAEEASLEARGEARYLLLRDELERTSPGRMVAIEADGGDWFVADTTMDAYRLASSAHPDRLFYFRRIGIERKPTRW